MTAVADQLLLQFCKSVESLCMVRDISQLTCTCIATYPTALLTLALFTLSGASALSVLMASLVHTS